MKKAEKLLNPDPVVINPEVFDEELEIKAQQSTSMTVGSSLIELGDKIIPEQVLDPVADADLLHSLDKQRTQVEPVTFVTHIRQLHVQAEVIRRNLKNQPVRVSKVIEFRNGSTTLTDPYEIKALRSHESFGGVGDKSANTGKEPLFWEGTFPLWKTKQMQEHTNQLRSTRYEQVPMDGGSTY